MSWHSVLTARLRALFVRRRLERELDDEVRFHLEMQADDNLRAGMNARQARLAAARSFGGVDAMKEQYRDRRALHVVETLVQDVRYAMRAMGKSPAFALVAVLSLAIGIGANTAVFSFVDALLLRPLSVPRPGEVITVGWTDEFGESLKASYRDYIDIRDDSKSFDGLVAFASPTVAVAVDAETLAQPRLGMLVSANLFTVMDVTPQWGRAFRPDEDQVPGRDAVVVLGHLSPAPTSRDC